MKETQAKRAAAEARLKRPTGRRRMTRDEITSLVTALGDMVQVLGDADPAYKAEVYSRLGLTLTYHPNEKRVEARSPTHVDHVRRSVSEGGLEPGIR
jgi:4-hydroxyphenylpyruvate dioxygenase-like putative hemolysin